jgi:Cys-rich protein (TIGR01571 family)
MNQSQAQTNQPIVINNNNNNNASSSSSAAAASGGMVGGMGVIAPVAVPVVAVRLFPKYWEVGICDCCMDPGIAVLSFIFPCHVCGLTRELESGAYCDGFFSGWCEFITWGFCFCCAPFFHQRRSNFRARNGIDGNCCEDIACMWFCNPLAIAQEHNEIAVRRGTMSKPPVATMI